MQIYGYFHNKNAGAHSIENSEPLLELSFFTPITKDT